MNAQPIDVRLTIHACEVTTEYLAFWRRVFEPYLRRDATPPQPAPLRRATCKRMVKRGEGGGRHAQ